MRKLYKTVITIWSDEDSQPLTEVCDLAHEMCNQADLAWGGANTTLVLDPPADPDWSSDLAELLEIASEEEAEQLVYEDELVRVTRNRVAPFELTITKVPVSLGHGDELLTIDDWLAGFLAQTEFAIVSADELPEPFADCSLILATTAIRDADGELESRPSHVYWYPATPGALPPAAQLTTRGKLSLEWVYTYPCVRCNAVTLPSQLRVGRGGVYCENCWDERLRD